MLSLLFADRLVQELDADDGPSFAMLAPIPDDDGYVSPDFDLPSASEDDEDVPPPPKKRNKTLATGPPRTSLEDEEELALQLLRRR